MKLNFDIHPIKRIREIDKKELINWIVVIIGVAIYRVVKRKKAQKTK
ncbi:hypothetical protein MUA90_06420 [Staphylococcus sp. IVB6181]|nr:hypothetical protein MUA90_06420 [Staphylococcus sp. IVB6181]